VVVTDGGSPSILAAGVAAEVADEELLDLGLQRPLLLRRTVLAARVPCGVSGSGAVVARAAATPR